MAGEFVPLADLLRPPATRAAVVEPRTPAAASSDQDGCDDGLASASPQAVAQIDVVAAMREARLFRARLADVFDDAAARLLRELASDVLARELRLAPCDLAALVRRVAERAPIVRVRVAACDAAALPGVPIVEDASLGGGDAIVELAGAALDARLGVRLATVLEAFA